MEYLRRLITSLEDEIGFANAERRLEALGDLTQLRLKILGQSALLANREFSSRMTLNQTRDLDAIIEGDWALRTILKRALQKLGLEYDDLSNESWIPPGSTFVVVHDSVELKIQLLDPFYVLLSKAVKAPVKNRILVRQALALYEHKLSDAIRNAGGNLEYFLG